MEAHYPLFSIINLDFFFLFLVMDTQAAMW